MYEVLETADTDEITAIMTNEELAEASLSDAELVHVKDGTWSAALDRWKYLALRYKGETVGLNRFLPITEVMVETHWHLLPEYWGTHISDDFDLKIIEWMKANTTFTKMMVQCPYSAEPAIKAAVRGGYGVEGMLTNAMIWRGKLQHMVLMTRSI